MTSSAIPFICIAPSPTSAIAGRSGCAHFAPITYGTPGPIVASVPDSDACIPLRIAMCRAHQFVADPESEVRIARSGSREDSSAATACGLTRPPKLWPARSAMMRFQVRTFFSISSRQERSSLRRSSGMSCFRVSLASPTRCASIG